SEARFVRIVPIVVFVGRRLFVCTIGFGRIGFGRIGFGRIVRGIIVRIRGALVAGFGVELAFGGVFDRRVFCIGRCVLAGEVGRVWLSSVGIGVGSVRSIGFSSDGVV